MKEVAGHPSWLDLLDPGLQLLAIIGGFAVVVWQMRKSHENSLRAQSQDHRETLKVEIHKEFLKPISEAISILAEANQFPTFATADLRSFRASADKAIKRGIPSCSMREFHILHMGVHSAKLKLISLLQSFEIINPRFRLFRDALASASLNLDMAYRAYSTLGFRILPLGRESDETQYRAPEPQRIAELDTLGHAYSDAASEMTGYVHDLSIELQKALLGELFRNGDSLSVRQPLDPNTRVIVLDDDEQYEQLRHYFDHESPQAVEWRSVRETMVKQ